MDLERCNTSADRFGMTLAQAIGSCCRKRN
jgi:hypothetical protein